MNNSMESLPPWLTEECPCPDIGEPDPDCKWHGVLQPEDEDSFWSTPPGGFTHAVIEEVDLYEFWPSEGDEMIVATTNEVMRVTAVKSPFYFIVERGKQMGKAIQGPPFTWQSPDSTPPPADHEPKAELMMDGNTYCSDDLCGHGSCIASRTFARAISALGSWTSKRSVPCAG